MNKNDNKYYDFLLIDIISMVVSFVLSYCIKFGDLNFTQSETWTPLLFVILLINLAISLFSNPYDGIYKRPYYEEIVHSLLQTFYCLLSVGVIFYVLKIGTSFSRQMVLSMFGIYFVLSLISKCLWKKLVISNKVKNRDVNKTPLLLIGDASSVSDAIHDSQSGDFVAYEVNGIFCKEYTEDKYQNVPIIKSEEEILPFVLTNGIKEVLVTAKLSNTNILNSLVSQGIAVHFAMDQLLGFQSEDCSLGVIGNINSLSTGKYSFSIEQKAYFMLKRLIDIIVGIFGCIILIPITVVVKLCYLMAKDNSPIIYTQSRVGKSGRIIKIYKFRTMISNADEVLKELLKEEKYREEWETNQKLTDDPRITKVGRFLRKTSVDELPQLINVLIGNMSLVGPRPLIEGELEMHNGMKMYQMLKPGITGWWGCNGRSNIDYAERLNLEYYYIKNVSAYLDFLCVLRTVLSVLKRDGAE